MKTPLERLIATLKKIEADPSKQISAFGVRVAIEEATKLLKLEKAPVPDNYALHLLSEALRIELIAFDSADKALREDAPPLDKLTISAFTESRRMAQERIPQLQSAIKLIKSNE